MNLHTVGQDTFLITRTMHRLGRQKSPWPDGMSPPLSLSVNICTCFRSIGGNWRRKWGFMRSRFRNELLKVNKAAATNGWSKSPDSTLKMLINKYNYTLHIRALAYALLRLFVTDKLQPYVVVKLNISDDSPSTSLRFAMRVATFLYFPLGINTIYPNQLQTRCTEENSHEPLRLSSLVNYYLN